MKKAVTLIELIMVITILSILVLVAVPKISSSYQVSNESAAQANLQTISVAAENYSTANSGNYPTAESQLTGATPPYLNRSFCSATVNGYTYSCTLNASSYTITATPSACGKTGKKNFTVTTGGAISSANCS